MLIKRKSIEADANLREGPGKKKTAERKPPRSIRFAPVTLSEQDGVRYLHFGTEWVQGAMRIRKPDALELEYAQQMMAWMLFVEQPRHIVQLGLGSAALTKFCYRNFPDSRTTAIELNEDVIAICRSMFKLPQDDERLQIINMDALDYITDPAHRGAIDALQIDLYDATARGPVLDTPEFYRSCRQSLTRTGVVTVNLFGDHPSYGRNLAAMRTAFDTVLCLPEVHDGNIVAIGFARTPAFDSAALYQRAADINASTGLPARNWVHSLKQSLEE
jgi:spermidine synthase